MKYDEGIDEELLHRMLAAGPCEGSLAGYDVHSKQVGIWGLI